MNVKPFEENQKDPPQNCPGAIQSTLTPSLALCYGLSHMECESHADIDVPFCHFVFHLDFTVLAQRTRYSNSVPMKESNYKNENN